MNDPESFAARWSRLKREADKKQEEPALVQPAALSAEAAPAEGTSAGERPGLIPAKAPSEAPFDPESLPPIDSITAGTDIKAFLRAGVPKDLTQAALRRAWTADPAIRDFIGLAENQWDFTDPTAMPGFGPLEATDDIRQLVAQAMGRLAESTKVEELEKVALASGGAPGEVPAALQTNNATPEEAVGHRQGHLAGEHRHDPEVGDGQQTVPARETGDVHGRRSHGGALPK